MKEEWRSIVVDGKEHPWYSVSNLGNVRSHLQPIRGGRKYNPQFYKDLKPCEKNRDGSIAALRFSIYFPEDFFEDYQYKKPRPNDPNVIKTCSAHELVMEAFRPMDDYPPDRLKDCWDDIPEEAKRWIKESPVINHKNHNPSDNSVDNLEYVTAKENTRAAVKYYGGNMSNKGKQNNDEFIIITEPKFNPLLQEWEDGNIEFRGEEGEECHNMLEEIAKDRGISPGDAFWEVIEDAIERERKNPGEMKKMLEELK